MLPPILADMDIALSVIEFLKNQSIDILTARDLNLGHKTDREILNFAFSNKRFVLTHDSDFGSMAIQNKIPIHGIIFMRPGSKKAQEVIDDLKILIESDIDWAPPVIAVFSKGRLRIRRFT